MTYITKALYKIKKVFFFLKQNYFTQKVGNSYKYNFIHTKMYDF